jgi:hypothetical protein
MYNYFLNAYLQMYFFWCFGVLMNENEWSFYMVLLISVQLLFPASSRSNYSKVSAFEGFNPLW